MVNGVQQWIIQRVANASFIVFGIALFCVLAATDGLTFVALTDLFDQGWVKLFLAVVLILAFINAWIAGWQIAGDYSEKFGIPDKVITVTAVVVSLLYLFYGFKIIF